ncbi:unnamed protein product [Arabidopsis halleri]
MVTSLFVSVPGGVTKSLKLYVLRWKSKEDYTSNWRYAMETPAKDRGTRKVPAINS